MPIDFFYANLGRWVLRNNTTFFIPDFEDQDRNRRLIHHLQDLQNCGFKFAPLPIAKPAIHISDSVCTSCEG